MNSFVIFPLKGLKIQASFKINGLAIKPSNLLFMNLRSKLNF